MKLKPSQIIGVAIVLLLIGILLPLGLVELTSFDDYYKESTTTYTSQSTPQNYSVSVKQNEMLNTTVDYDSSGDDLLVISVYYPNYTLVGSDNTDANSINYNFNSTILTAYTIAITNTTTGTVSFNITIHRKVLVNYQASVVSLVSEVIPIIAIVGILIAFIPRKRN